MIYRKMDPTNIYDADTLIYVQEARLDKYRQKLASLTTTANVGQGFINSEVTKNNASNSNSHHYFYGRGRNTHGRGRDKKTYISGNKLTCQLWNKYIHSVLECWYKFDENVEHVHHKP